MHAQQQGHNTGCLVGTSGCHGRITHLLEPSRGGGVAGGVGVGVRAVGRAVVRAVPEAGAAAGDGVGEVVGLSQAVTAGKTRQAWQVKVCRVTATDTAVTCHSRGHSGHVEVQAYSWMQG